MGVGKLNKMRYYTNYYLKLATQLKRKILISYIKKILLSNLNNG